MSWHVDSGGDYVEDTLPVAAPAVVKGFTPVTQIGSASAGYSGLNMGAGDQPTQFLQPWLIPAGLPAAVGFSGPTTVFTSGQSGGDFYVNPGLSSALDTAGVTVQRSYDGISDSYTTQGFNSSGAKVGDSLTYENAPDTAFAIVAAVVATFVTAGIATGYIGGAAGTGAAVGTGDAALIDGGTNLFADGAIAPNYAAGDAWGGLAASSGTSEAAIEGGTNLFADGAIAPNYAAGDAWGSLLPSASQVASGASTAAQAAGGGGSTAGASGSWFPSLDTIIKGAGTAAGLINAGVGLDNAIKGNTPAQQQAQAGQATAQARSNLLIVALIAGGAFLALKGGKL